MAVNITGATWTAGMTVNAANVGCAAISSSGTLTCVASPASGLWPGSLSSTYIETSENATLVIQPETQPFGAAPAGGDSATQSIYIMAVPSTPASIPPSAFGFLNNQSLNGKAAGLIFVLKQDVNQPGMAGGMIAFLYNSTDSAGNGLTEAGYCPQGNGVSISQQLRPTIGQNIWTQISERVIAGASGSASMYINGQLASQMAVSGSPTFNTGTTAAQLNGISTWTLPAIAGYKWRLGAMKTESATPAILTDVYRAPTNHLRDRYWPVTFSATSATDGYGLITTAGTVRTAVRPYSLASLGGPPNDRIVAHLAVGGGNTYTYTWPKAVGAPVYNADNWKWYVFTKVMIKAASSGQAGLLDNTNTSLVKYLYWNGSNQFFDSNAASGTPLCIIPSSAAVCVDMCIGLCSDGRAHYVIVDHTTNHAGTATTRKKIIHQGPLSNWTTSTVFGKPRIQNLFGSGGFEHSGFAEFEYLPFAGCDSFSENRFAVLNWKYITYASSSTALAVGDVLVDPAGTTFNVMAVNTTDKWAMGGPLDDFAGGAGAVTNIIRSGSNVGTVTTATASLDPTWIGYTPLAGTFVASDVLTELTSTATYRLMMSDLLNPGIGIPTGMMALYNTASTLLVGGQTLTGTILSTGATCTGDIPQLGCFRSNLYNGTSASVYDGLADSGQPGFYCPYTPTGGSPSFAISFLAAAGRGGHTMGQAHQGASLAGIPCAFWYLFGGMTNSFGAADAASADAAADLYVDSVMGEAESITANKGYVVIEEESFPSPATGSYNQAQAARIFARATPALRSRVGANNADRRITIVPNMGFPGSTDGTHYNVAGAALRASQAATSKTMIALTTHKHALPV